MPLQSGRAQPAGDGVRDKVGDLRSCVTCRVQLCFPITFLGLCAMPVSFLPVPLVFYIFFFCLRIPDHRFYLWWCSLTFFLPFLLLLAFSRVFSFISLPTRCITSWKTPRDMRFLLLGTESILAHACLAIVSNSTQRPCQFHSASQTRVLGAERCSTAFVELGRD